MSRGASFTCGMLVIASAMVIGFGAVAQNNPQTNRSGLPTWRLGEPITYKNLSIFPVVSNQPASADTSHFMTLDEALKTGDVVVKERGSNTSRRSPNGHGPNLQQQEASVNQLVLINRGTKPLVLLAGELVQGGEQDRIISQDRIVPPGAEPLPLDVFCVEQGRWSSGEEFASGKMMVHPSVREKAAVDQQQEKVWQAVLAATNSPASFGGLPSPGPPPPAAARLTAPGILSSQTVNSIVVTEASTRSYARIYRSSRVETSVRPFAKEIEKRFAQRIAEMKGEYVVGAVVAYGGDVAWSDIFASPALFERYWSKLRRSYVVEALARPQTTQRPSLDDALVFLQPIDGDETLDSGGGLYRLRRVMQPEYVEITLDALRPIPINLHTIKIHRTPELKTP